MRNRILASIITLTMLCIAGFANAQTTIVRPNLSIPSKIGPAYFGPNAFPVPDMLDGRTSADMRLELYGDCFLGTTTGSVADDVTADMFARLTIPLFTPKANLTVWMPIFEYFHTSAEVNALRRLPHKGDLKGFDSGDAYVSADIRILSQERHHCDMTVRAALKTASANRFAEGRCYDAPGYFFDVSVGRGLQFGKGGGILRVALSTGFLCWQTDNGRQNDAVMYGALLAYKYKRFGIDTCLGGYVGWEGDGDRPMTIKTNLSYAFGDWSLRLSHQAGLMDWHYHQIRIGVVWNFDILSRISKK
ncbi:MAG: hypothetical protein E7130_04855 [Rikenellaceae bacterium]|nr:hypothetical protein [Rikenellaceae bacterium]